MKMEPYESVLQAIRPEVSFTIRIFRASQLGPLQVGYSISPTGKSLAGDTTEEAFPVFRNGL